MLFLAHSFKDKANLKENNKGINLENLKEVNAGLFDYPILMASDILIYGGEIVPVGQDQIQHIEYAREIAKKYNLAYQTKTFKYATEFINQEVATVLGTDGKKMSKSKNNQIALFGNPDEIKKKIISIKTDSKMPNESKNPDENNIYNIHKLFLNKSEVKKLREKFLNSNKVAYSYKEAKEELFESYLKYFQDMQKQYDYYTKTEKGKKEVFKILKQGAKKAKQKAEKTMQQVRLETGLTFK